MSDGAVLSDALATAVEAAGPGVVRIDGRCGGGTGSVWSADGVVVTAHHALDRDEGLSVTLGDGRTLAATVAGRDPGTDVAVLRVAATDLTPLAWADGEDLKVGHLLLVLGRPGRTVRATLGVASAVGEGFRTPAGGRLDRYIETDASLPRGFSGGPMLDLKGRVLGFNTAALIRGGVTVPTATLRRVVPELLAHGAIGKGYVGVGVYPVRLPPALEAKAGQRGGLVLVSVEPGSPAEKAGLLVGDVLLTFDGHATERPGDLTAALEGRAGVAVPARTLRAGDVRDVQITTGQKA